MNKFPFNQPDKTKDCGYRCLYYCVPDRTPYEKWLDNFRFFAPVKSGITLTDICAVLNYYKIDYKYTQLTDRGKFIVYSGVWLKPEGKNHGHYFIYENGTVYCSTRSEPYQVPLTDAITRMEAKTIDGSFKCLQILGPVED